MTCCANPHPVMAPDYSRVVCGCGAERPDPREALARLLAALDESNHWLRDGEAAAHARRVLEETR